METSASFEARSAPLPYPTATGAGLLVAWMRQDLKRSAPVFLAALSAYAAALMQVRLHEYYFQTCYPFFAAIWAYLMVSIYEGACLLARNFRRRGWRLAAGLIWIVFANAVFWPLPDEFGKLTMRYEELREWRADPERSYSNYTRQLPCEFLRGQFDVIHYLEKNAKPNDGVYLWGANCSIYYFSGHQPQTRFISNLGLMSPWCPNSWRDELVRDLRNAQPRFIVVKRHDALPALTYVNLDSEEYLKVFPKLDSFITENYKPVADLDAFVIYRRNDFLGVAARDHQQHGQLRPRCEAHTTAFVALIPVAVPRFRAGQKRASPTSSISVSAEISIPANRPCCR